MGRSYEMIEVERVRRVDSIDEPPLAQIKESLDSFHCALEERNQFGIYQIDDDTLSELEQQENGENKSRPIILDDSNTESETPREKELPNTEETTINLEEEEEELEEDVEIDRQERTNVDRHATGNIDRHSGNNIDRRSTPAEPPFPPNKRQTKCELIKLYARKHSIRSCWKCH
ncbi:hypothetical protein F2Q69_00052391 [Brassica cretica]|uniref:Uncharacterized protein n=1 Tax=Brassica cretica TaxID=69181 RepID=A0A8S9MQT5_BRACR|nr:hypothetical protein F2Q69_00052391 [Brassica cretica]